MKFDDIKKNALIEWAALVNSDKPRILVGAGTCGRAAGALIILDRIRAKLIENNIEAIITQVGCIGPCYAEPLIDIIKPGRPHIFYANLTPELAIDIIEDYLVNDNPRPDLAMGTIGETKIEGIPKLFELPMLKKQVRFTLRNCGLIDPENINHYIAKDGYNGLIRTFSMMPEDVINEIKTSGLRGRGGAGFSTATKWELCRKAPGTIKYVICNADEGDPGAFMNRSLLEGDPHAVIEGLLIGAYAIGASQGYIYCRAEKPLAIERLSLALKQADQYGFLGENIMGSGFNCQIELREGAGAFVCGEETALMASIEGKRGMPRPRPPFPAQAGLWGKPTNINNVETWGNVSGIMRPGGAKLFASFGSAKSKGTKTFALVGKIKRTGLIEVPLGISLQEIIYEIGGGILNDNKFKAVQTGGPSGGCIPPSLLDLPVDYESLTQAGSIMGSGGMVVMDENTCMVDLARYFLTFTQSESCGKCVPCRLGTKQMLGILTNITQGKGRLEDIDLLLNIGQQIKAGSLCGLGQTAPNPVLTTIKYFRTEYEEHIKYHHCRAAVCRGLVTAPCSHICPAGIDVPRYIRAIARNKPEDAVSIIREKIPFPAVCGLVCFHPCEAKCRRAQLDEAIAIRILKRYATEHNTGAWKDKVEVASQSGKSVAVIGSGPAGLTTAYYLTKLGHKVTIFEALPEPGGMMRFGIPDYRLPKHILNAEIAEIERFGVVIKTNTRIDSPERLFSEGYNAVFVALGAHVGIKIGVPGDDSPHVIECVDFLKDVSLGKVTHIGQSIAVIGGGNAAVDAARTARRLGAQDVSIIYRRTRNEMPASPEEVAEAIAEDITLTTLAAPSKITDKNGKVELESIRMELGAIDESGRKQPYPIKGSEFTRFFDTVIASVGQRPEIPPQFNINTGKGNLIQVNPDTLATNREGIFAGGDVISGPASVIEAIAAGRKAACSLDKYLGGKGDIDEVLAPLEKAVEPLDESAEKCRVEMPLLAKKKRLSGFSLIELGYSDAMAIEEAGRCLRCDLEESEEQ